jgi:hypothetical protein
MNGEQIETDQHEGTRPHPSPLLIGLFWLITVLPLAWGIYNTVLQSLQLLR